MAGPMGTPDGDPSRGDSIPRNQARYVPGPAQEDAPPWRLARVITLTALGGCGGLAALNVARDAQSPLDAGTGLVFTAAIVGAHSSIVRVNSLRLNYTKRTLILGIQTLLTYVPLIWFDLTWGGMAGPLAGAVLLLMPGRTAWPLFGLVIVSIFGYSLAIGAPPLSAGYVGLANAMTGLVLFGIARLNNLLLETHASRVRLARESVDRERLRFARDLHDLLSYSISAITLKGELSRRMVMIDTERARGELDSLLEISRQALADVRELSGGYRTMSLAGEAEAVSLVLASADISAETDISGAGELAPETESALAIALREGVTNVLRHSNAQKCAITAFRHEDRIRLVLVNDGLTERNRTPALCTGNGIANLTARLTALGGRLETRVTDGCFHLLAEAPLTPQPRQSTGMAADLRASPGLRPREP